MSRVQNVRSVGEICGTCESRETLQAESRVGSDRRPLDKRDRLQWIETV
ncbi:MULTISPECIES: hypothetical protein [Peribacillus]|nr:hypothetical protein [Peribacillus simplex]